MKYFTHVINLEKACRRARPESFTVNNEQCQAIMEVYDLLDLKAFTVQYQVELLTNGAFEILGSLNAVVSQPSVVSFEPVTTKVSEPFSVILFASEKRLQEYEESNPYGDSDVFTDGEYDLGNLALEYLSLSLPSNPRLPGEIGDYIEFDSDEKQPRLSPLAELADKLKDD